MKKLSKLRNIIANVQRDKIGRLWTALIFYLIKLWYNIRRKNLII